MRYYIADLHFFHANMNTKIDHRGFASVEEMNELLTRLNGRLYLITGNHDRFVRQPEFRSSRFTWIKPYEEISDNKRKVVLCHYPIMCRLLWMSG